jgi:ribosome maturation factor RimP
MGQHKKVGHRPAFFIADWRRMADAIARIEKLIGPTIDSLGYELVRVTLGGGRQSVKLQVMAERKDRRAMTVEDCAEISRTISAVLDVEDPIESAYTLEVSSPGIDRPLTRADDFERFKGYEARIESTRPIEGRRKFKGILEGVQDGQVRIACEGAEIRVPLSEVQKAKLVINDALLNAARTER